MTFVKMKARGMEKRERDRVTYCSFTNLYYHYREDGVVTAYFYEKVCTIRYDFVVI